VSESPSRECPHTQLEMSILLKLLVTAEVLAMHRRADAGASLPSLRGQFPHHLANPQVDWGMSCLCTVPHSQCTAALRNHVRGLLCDVCVGHVCVQVLTRPLQLEGEAAIQQVITTMQVR
jgi:hypothetical protein